MGTIRERKKDDGTLRYLAEIRINRNGIKFSQSKTFSTKTLAKSWIKKRESELEANPELLQKKDVMTITFKDLIKSYIDGVGHNFGATWQKGILAIANMPIGNVRIDRLTGDDFFAFATGRLKGTFDGYKAIKPVTLKGDMIMIRAVLLYAEMVLGLDVPIAEFEKVMRGLSKTRQVTASTKRTRLPTSDELRRLTHFFYDKYKKYQTALPMHLVIWFAIYSGRRQNEIAHLRISDINQDWWLVRDMKNPKGSKGNHHHALITDKLKALLPLLLDKDLRERQKRRFRDYDDDLLIPTQGSSISTRFTEACKVLGIEDLHFHDLRHECATRLAEHGKTIPQIQQVTCHTTWSSLQRYVNIRQRPDVIEFDDIALDD